MLFRVFSGREILVTVHGLSGSDARQSVDALQRSLHRLATVGTNGLLFQIYSRRVGTAHHVDGVA